MARLFDRASSQYLYRGNTTVPVTGPPVSIAGWYQPANDDQNCGIFTLDNDISEHCSLYQTSAGKISLIEVPAGGSATTTATITIGQWHHVAATTDGTDRAVYLDGANKATGSNFSNHATGWDSCGIRYDSASSVWPDGGFAGFAVWSAVLSDAEVAALADGADPRTIRPESLVAYWPLVRTDQDIVGGYDLTATNNPTWTDGPGTEMGPARVHVGLAVSGEAGDLSVSSASDSASVTDIPALWTDLYHRSVSDSASVSDTPTAKVSDPATSVSDSTSVTDTPTIGPLALARSVQDTASVTDTPTVAVLQAAELAVSVSDTCSVADTPATQPLALARFVSDSAGVSDTPSTTVVVGLSVSELVTVTDTPTADIGDLAAFPSETVTVTDSPSATLPEIGAFSVSVQDGVTVTDSPSAGPLAMALFASENISATDTPAAAVSGVDLNVEILAADLFRWVQGVKIG